MNENWLLLAAQESRLNEREATLEVTHYIPPPPTAITSRHRTESRLCAFCGQEFGARKNRRTMYCSKPCCARGMTAARAALLAKMTT